MYGGWKFTSCQKISDLQRHFKNLIKNSLVSEFAWAMLKCLFFQSADSDCIGRNLYKVLEINSCWTKKMINPFNCEDWHILKPMPLSEVIDKEECYCSFSSASENLKDSACRTEFKIPGSSGQREVDWFLKAGKKFRDYYPKLN